MSNTLRSGETRELAIPSGGSIAISSIAGTVTADVVAGTAKGTNLLSASTGGGTFGPYASGAVVRVTAGVGAIVDYDIGTAPVNNYDQNAKLAFAADGTVAGIADPVGGGTQYLSSGVSGTVQTVVIGDSVTAQNNGGNAVISAATRTGNIVTCTSTSHGFGDQVISDIVNIIPMDMNANGVTITRIDANTFSYPSVGPDATSSAAANKPRIAINRQSQADIGYFVWLNALSGGAFNLVRNAGANGNTAADMRARFARDVSAFNYEHVVILTGYNDFVLETRTAQAVYDDVVAMVGVAGIKMVTVVSALPWTTGGTNANRAQAVAYNRMMRNYCNAKPNVRFADAAKYLVDSVNATRFSPLAGMLVADGIHPSPRGAYWIAKAIWDVNSARVSVPSRITSSNADNYGFDAVSKNINDNAPWTNTGGALGGTASGTVAAGWGVTNNGGGTTVASVVARSDGLNYAQRAVFTPSASSDNCVVSLSGASWATGRFTAGQKVRVSLLLSLTGLAGANIRSIEARMGFNNSPATSAHALTATQPNASTYMNVDGNYTLVSQDIVVPAGATTMSWQITATAAAAGTALTIDVGGLAVELLS